LLLAEIQPFPFLAVLWLPVKLSHDGDVFPNALMISVDVPYLNRFRAGLYVTSHGHNQ